MVRAPGLSVRAKLALSYAGFLMLAGVLLLTAVWLFLLRDLPLGMLMPRLENFARVFDPGNAGPVIFGPAISLALAFLLVFGLLGGWILAGYMLAPMNRISEATRQVAEGSLSHRIRLPGRRDEIRDLADAFDAMLNRLEQRVGEQQRFAANAAHELRTPLATMQAMLEVARSEPDRDSTALVQRLQVVNARAIELTEALLLLSRADQHAFTREPVDLTLLAEEAAETLLPLAEARGIAISVTGESVFTSGSRALLLQMITNLLHNGIVHNLGGEGGTVSVTTSADGEAATLVIENTGEALDPQLVPMLTEPFQRGAGRINQDHAGVGLGLAIVNSIARAHVGSLHMAPRAGGGLRVLVQLPRRTNASPGRSQLR